MEKTNKHTLVPNQRARITIFHVFAFVVAVAAGAVATHWLLVKTGGLFWGVALGVVVFVVTLMVSMYLAVASHSDEVV